MRRYSCLVPMRPADRFAADFEGLINEWLEESLPNDVDASALNNDNGAIVVDVGLHADSETDAAMQALDLMSHAIEAIESSVNVRFYPIVESEIDVRQLTPH